MQSFLNYGNRGTILIEIAIAITVLSIITGFSVAKYGIYRKIQRERITKDNIENVTIALAAFVAKNKRLPLPSGSSGEESTTNEHMIPYQTLGIDRKYTLDGDANPLIYIPEPFLTQNFSAIYEDDLSQKCFCEGYNSRITIQGMQHQTVAFVIGTRKSKISFNQNSIHVVSDPEIFWISRDMLLVKFLKSSPCMQFSASSQKTETPDIFDF